MKRYLALFISLLMVVLSVNVSADSTQSEELNKVLLSVKDRIGSTDQYTEFQSSVSDYSGRKFYRFEWSKDSEDGGYNSLSVTVDDTGIITSYNNYQYTARTETKPKIKETSYNEAEICAKELIDVLNPQISQSLRLSSNRAYESLYSKEFSFNIQRYENDIPVMGDSGYVTISEDLTRILHFDINYSPKLTFENEKAVISHSDAIHAFKENIGLKLCYVNTYKDNKNNITLRYVPSKSSNVYIDAVTGKAVTLNYENLYGDYKYSSNDSMAEGMSTGSSLSRVEIDELQKVEGLLGEEQIKNIIYSLKILSIDRDYKVESSRLSRDYKDNNKYILSLNFSKQENDTKLWKDISVDARTGEILSYYKAKDYQKNEQNVVGEKALKKAEEYVKILAPTHFNKEECEFKLNTETDNNTGFTYVRYPNGVEFDDNFVRIEIDSHDGSLLNYSIRYDKIDFPSCVGVLSMEEANLKLFEQISYNVWYMPQNTTAIKVYSYEDANPKIDANTGKLISTDYESKPIVYNDIENHYAKEAIKTLARYGIGFEEDSFMPDSFIIQKDFVSLVNAVFYDRGSVVIGKQHDSSSAYRYLQDRGVIKPEEYMPDGLVTREMAAKMLIRGMGLEEVAKCHNIFIPLYKDVTQDIGYTSILGAMGVVNGDENGCFNPQNTLTRADAIIMLYNYLAR